MGRGVAIQPLQSWPAGTWRHVADVIAHGGRLIAGNCGPPTAANERQVGVHLTDSGKAMQSRTGCLTDTLLERSGLTVDELISLNKRVQALRNALAASSDD
ncbi:hypothetical protein HAP47_0032485 [Bradyrhizobium sp. 41S5]|uniref:hypothetical protein n=1 Tax=Bradyrhizobium sp. 41S5 TaxID=1404443 RepID=UPI00156A948F|nr:hypothetical protein [Bradyrhizobium sp. 41S5]UFX43889.1 hypothetical protein HAP47_0032485 [Bradyrhizobium sp. 41S5]